MAIQFKGTTYLRSPAAWGAESYAEFTCICVYQFNGHTRPAPCQFPVYSNSYQFLQGNYTSGGTTEIQGSQTDVGVGRPWLAATVGGLPAGVPVQVAMVYSASNPGRRFLDINGNRANAGWDAALGGNIRLDAGWSIGGDGTNPSNLELQSLLFIDKALTDAELEAYRADAAGTVASLTSAVKRYYSLNGAIGADVQTGDAGISIEGDPDHSLVVVTGPGSTAKYIAPIAAQRATVDQVYVPTSGDAIVLSLTKPGGVDDLASVNAAEVAAMTYPRIRINGGPPITLDSVGSGRAYSYAPNGAFFWLLPEGVGPLTNSDVVTISAPMDWVGSEIGGTDGMTDRVVDMRVGIPSSKPSDGQIKVGGQCTTYASSIWSGNKVMANVAKLMEIRGDKWPDGTARGNFGQRIFWYPGETYFDSYGWDPTPYYDLWLLQWEDYGEGYSTFVDMFIKSELPTVDVEQLDAYSTDVDGKHTRVLRVSKLVWDLTLATSVDAAATSIQVVDTPSPSWQGFPDAPYFIVIQIGSEKIRANGWDPGTKTFTGCVRGWNGTTAAGHAATTAFTAFHTNNTFGLWLWTTHDETHRYKNLQLYPPGNWTKPESPGPVAYTPEDHYAIDSYFWDNFLSRGLGPHRVMECAGGMFDDRSEIDDVSVASDLVWNFNKKHHKLVFDRVEPFAPLTGPPRFFYFNYEASHLQTYSATLVDAIDATTTTVRLTRTTTEPDSRIPYGQALFIGGERMQVVGIPAVGDDHYTVWRGRMGTTAAGHPAGAAATVGWRFPITNSSQYSATDPVSAETHYLKYSEIFVDEGASLTPMRTGLFMQGGPNQNFLDMMVTARRSFTLTSAFGPTDLVAHIQPAAPEDWDWLKPQAWIYLNGERLKLISADPEAGTLTFSRRDNNPQYDDDTWARDPETGNPVTPVSLPIGTAGTQTAAGPLWSTEDGSIQYYEGLYNYGPPLMPTGAASAVYMIAGSTNVGATLPMRVKATQFFNKTVAFKPRTDDHLQEYSPWNSIPYDFHAMMCKKTREAAGPGSGDAWICVSYGASDDMMYEIAKIYRDILPAGSKLYMEYGNEVWNYFINSLKTYSNAHAWSTGIQDGVITAYYHFLRSCRMIEIGRACFAEVGRADDFKGTIAWQIGGLTGISDSLIHLESLGFSIPVVDAISDAPYTVIAPNEVVLDYKKTFDICTNEQAVDLMQFEFEFGPDFSHMMGSAKVCCDALQAQYGWRPSHACYEGGPGNMAPAVPDSYPDCLNVRVNDFQRTMDLIAHPNFRHWMRSFYDVVRRRSFADAISIFCFGRPPGQSNNYLFQLFWGIVWHDRHKAGRGDGTDGLSDNRLHLWQQGKPNSVNGEFDSAGVYGVSPGLLALQEHNNESFGAPFLTSAVVSGSGASVVLTFNQAVDPVGGPAAFFVTANTTDVPVVGLAQPAANVVVLTLGDVILAGRTVMVSGTGGCVKNASGRPNSAFYVAALNQSVQAPSDPGTGTITIARARPWPFGSNSRYYRGYRGSFR